MENYSIEFLGSPGRDMHLHQDTELLFVLQGSVTLELLDKRYTLHADDIFAVNSNNRHGWHPAAVSGQGGQETLVCELHFGQRMLRDYFDMPMVYYVCNSSAEKSRKYDDLRGILSELMSECALHMDRPTLMKTSLVCRLVSCLSAYFIADRAIDAGQSEDLRVNELLQYINTNHHRTLSLEEMSSLLGISPSSFSRYFKKRTGLTFVKYLNNVRLHFALEDLLYTDAPVTVIAENNGFSNASAFCRAFGEQYGDSPARYRAKHKKGTAAGRHEETAAGSAENTEKDSDALRALSGYSRSRELSGAAGPQQSIIRINADVSRSEPNDNHWSDAIVLGDCSEILTSSFRRQVSEAKAQLRFRYAKIEHLFDDAMKLRKGHARRAANFDNLDEVFDFLVSENICPIVSLDNKPVTITGSLSDLLTDYAPVAVFKDLDECTGVLSDIMRHFVSRYGLHEVQTWIFDLWYDEYTDNVLGMKTAYPACFAAISRCIKRHAPGVQVGGCGLSPSINREHFRKLLKEWSASEEAPDFLSVYMYPYLRYDNVPEGQSTLKKHSDFINEELTSIDREMAAVGWDRIPVKVTGWNLSLIHGDTFNDSCGKGAIMLAGMAGSLHSVSLAAFESLSDRSSSEHLYAGLLTGSRGLMTHDGICKPAFFAIQFVSLLQERLIEKGQHYIITTDAEGTGYTILCFNEKEMHIGYYAYLTGGSRHADFPSLFADESSREFIFTLRNIPNGTYHIRQYCVSPEAGSIADTLSRTGEPGAGRDAEYITYLKRITTPRILHETVTADSRRLILIETLLAHEFRLIRIQKQS